MKKILIFSFLLNFISCSQFVNPRTPASHTLPFYWIQNGSHAGERAIKFHNDFYRWQSDSGWTSEFSQTINNIFPDLTTNQKWLSFLIEAQKIIDLAENNLSDSTLEYKKLFSKTKNQVSCYSITPPLNDKIMNQAVKNLKAKLQYHSEEKVQSIDRVVAQLKSIWSPQGIKENFWDETLVVPLSVNWFESDPELKIFWQEQWIQSGLDIRIPVGNSGEGVVKNSEGYNQMKTLLLKTGEWIQQHSVKEIAKSPEATWITIRLDKLKSEDYQRIIFINKDTWVNLDEPVDYAEFVLVNQQISFVPTFSFFSLILHEANVNSGSTMLLPMDTHLDPEQTEVVLNSSELPKDKEIIPFALQIQPELSLISLASYLNELDKLYSCK